MDRLDICSSVPTFEDAEFLLEEGKKLNPGPWVEHSMHVGKAAELIACHCPDLNSETALVTGMLHDIGRRFGVTSMRHSIDGYNFLTRRGYVIAARICITHSFPYKNIHAVFGKWDCSPEEFGFVESFLENTEFDDYDRLIQLCDALALPEGFCLIEKRLVDVALRYGLNELIVPKWKEIFKIQKYFEDCIGKSLYSVLPGVVKNTFGF